MKRLLFVPALLFLMAPALRAEPPRQFVLTPKAIEEAPGFLTQVVAPLANCAAVDASGSMLVVGCTSKEGKHLAVFRLDEKGQPQAEATWLALPKPEALSAKTNYALGLLFHPRLPLLYVWQDIAVRGIGRKSKTAIPREYLEFHHLVVYAIKDGALELVQTAGGGDEFRPALHGGTIGLHRDGRTLFLPNATTESSEEAAVAAYELDEQGLLGEVSPVFNEPPVGKKVVEHSLTTETGKKARKEAENKMEKKLRARASARNLRTHQEFPSGTSWFMGTEAWLMGGYSGCMISDVHNGGVRQTWFHLSELSGAVFVSGHPTAPAAYLCLQESDHLYAMGQVNGYLSLLPQEATVTGATFVGTPVVLAKQSRVAVGDSKGLHLFGLKPDGKLDGTVERLPLSSASVKGFTYSEKHSRLYVAVDEIK